MNCNEVARCLEQQVPALLSATESSEIESHVVGCRHCAQLWRVARELPNFRTDVPPLPESLHERAWQLEALCDQVERPRQSRRPWIIGSLLLFGVASSTLLALPWRSESAELAE